MEVIAYKTSKVLLGDNLFTLLDTYLPPLHEKDIVVVTSKIVSICQGSVISSGGKTVKDDLIRHEADAYIDRTHSKYDVTLSIKNKTLIANSGVDESNGGGYFVLWPKEPYREAEKIWKYLQKKYEVRDLGVIITDSHAIPLRWGTTGLGIAWCGFEPLKNYIDTPDIFGRNLHMTKQSLIDGLAAAAVVVMGEGNEQTPLAVISEADPVRFVAHPPTQEEIQSMVIEPENDLFAPLLVSPLWKKGGAI